MNNLSPTMSDLMTSVTHEIVENAEKLFSAVHDDESNIDKNPCIGNFCYSQLYFPSSCALDWSSVYSMMESIVLRNMLHDENNVIVRQIFDTQQIIDDILDDNPKPSKADNVLTQQLVAQLIELKVKLHQACQTKDMRNIQPLQLFQKNQSIFKPKARRRRISRSVTPLKSIENIQTNVNTSNQK